MDENDWLAARFEEHRGELRAVAYRMLGSLSEADDAPQETWLRLSRTDVSDVHNLAAWLTTVVGRVCLGMLRSRRIRREQPFSPHLPDPVISPAEGIDPGTGGAAGRRGRARPACGARSAPASRTPGLRAARHVRRAV